MIASTDQDKDVVDFLAAVVGDAHHQAEMVVAFLESIDYLPPEADREEKTWHLPPGLLLKLGALTKLYLLEKAGLKDQLSKELPSWQDVYHDVIAETAGKELRFSGEQLSTDLLKILSQRLCWTPIENSAAAVAISQTIDPDKFLDEFAELLWESRHLGHDIRGDNNEPKNKE
jgi:hypothetical protein